MTKPEGLSEVGTLESRKAKLVQEIGSLESTLATNKKSIEAHQSEADGIISAAKNSARNLVDSAGITYRKADDHSRMIQDLKESLEKAKKDLETETERYRICADSYTRDRQVYRDRDIALNARDEALRAKSDEIEDSKKTIDTQTQELNSNISKHKAEIEAFHDELHKAKETIVKLDKAKNAHDTRRDQLQKDQKRADRKIEEASEVMRVARVESKKSSDLEQKLLTKENDLEARDKRLKNWNDQITQDKTMLDLQSRKLRKRERDVRAREQITKLDKHEAQEVKKDNEDKPQDKK